MPGPDLLEIADPLTHLLGSWSLDRARDGAWSAARLLWGAARAARTGRGVHRAPRRGRRPGRPLPADPVALNSGAIPSETPRPAAMTGSPRTGAVHG